MSTLKYNHCVENRKDYSKLSLFASWTGAMINPQWLELPMSRTNFHGPKDVWAIEVRLYLVCIKRKSAYKHVPYAQIQIILRMRKISFRPLLSIHTSYSIHWSCWRTVKALIRLRGCICQKTRFRQARPIWDGKTKPFKPKRSIFEVCIHLP